MLHELEQLLQGSQPHYSSWHLARALRIVTLGVAYRNHYRQLSIPRECYNGLSSYDPKAPPNQERSCCSCGTKHPQEYHYPLWDPEISKPIPSGMAHSWHLQLHLHLLREETPKEHMPRPNIVLHFRCLFGRCCLTTTQFVCIPR